MMRGLGIRVLLAVALSGVVALWPPMPADAKLPPWTCELVPAHPTVGRVVTVVVRFYEDAAHTRPATWPNVRRLERFVRARPVVDGRPDREGVLWVTVHRRRAGVFAGGIVFPDARPYRLDLCAGGSEEGGWPRDGTVVPIDPSPAVARTPVRAFLKHGGSPPDASREPHVREGPMDVADLLRYAVERRASDLHLSAGNVPFIRVDGELLPTPFPVLEPNDTHEAAEALMPAHKAEEFARSNEADFAFSLDGVGRFRVNVLRQRASVGLAIRQVASEGQTFEELHLPAVVQTLAESRRGLVLVTGPTGAGKTTTIAAMLGFINRTRRAHIVTIEDPIEVVHTDVMSVIRQREVGPDTESYGSALRQVLRQDPDVIFIGEIRDVDSATAAIQAAQTGHLVLSTMHTIDATETVDRFLEMFPAREQRQVRTSLAGALRGIVSQRLLERLDGRGRVPAVEVLINTGRVYDRILDAESTSELADVIAESTYDGMQTFDQALLQLVREGLVSAEDARVVATNPHDFGLALGAASGRPSLVREGA